MPLVDLPGTTTPYASFSQKQPKTSSYFRNRISKAKATSASHTEAIFTGCLPLASLSLASFLLLAGRLLWRFLEETKRKRDTRNTKHGEEHGRENKCIFCVYKSIFPKSLAWQATDEETRPPNPPALQHISHHMAQGVCSGGSPRAWHPSNAGC